MEVAGQWRREWAGTAEYGKVTEGGVTRRVARAMEVMQANGPGSRMRVLRAAYHSTAGPGMPSESFMMHSSRRVISSGSSFLEPPAFMAKPLEISSTPLEATPERILESENYKVTEPDDTEISEPSKWRSSTDTSVRMPSEDSSSTADNISIIDLDSRTNISKHTSLLRKSSFDSDSSDIQSKQPYKRRSSRASPLLDPPVTLSTLKYKSLLNGNTDSWNDRRKSYSFEDTSPLNETILHNNDTLAMESSTDSGICKSTEVVNETTEERTQQRFQTIYEPREETFKEWLAKNRHYKKETPHREHYIIEEPSEDKIALQSNGKVSITLPMNNGTDDKFQYMKTHMISEADRRIKRVEFCKTELHFAAESGKVNIIATDEKPPPSNDFRKRRSAFVPIKATFDKPVTLFGERVTDFPKASDFEIREDVSEFDENTAATKGILKNPIPKPKPYLLGENMVFGQDVKSEIRGIEKREYIIPMAVSLINEQLQSQDKGINNDKCNRITTNTKNNIESTSSVSATNSNFSRTKSDGPLYDDTPEEEHENQYFLRLKSGRNSFREGSNKFQTEDIEPNNTNSIKQKLRKLQTSPVQVKPRTRQLRDNELTYFGIDNSMSRKEDEQWKNTSPIEKRNNDLQSVRLIQRVSRSACNSETESEDAPEYQNLPIKTNFAPVPIPRTRTRINDFYMDRHDDEDKTHKIVILKPIIEHSYEVRETEAEQGKRRSRHRRNDITPSATKSRSISEPPKYRRRDVSKEPPVQEYNHPADNKTENSTSFTKSRHSKALNLTKANLAPKPTDNHVGPSEEEDRVYINIEEQQNVNKPEIIPLKLKPEHGSSSRQIKSTVERRKNKSNANKNESNTGDKKESSKLKSSRQTNSIEKKNDERKHKTEKDIERSIKSKDSLRKDRKRTETTASPIALVPADKNLKNSEKRHEFDNKQHVSRRSHQESFEKPKEKHSSRGKQSSTSIDRSVEKAKRLEDKSGTRERKRSRSRDKTEMKHDVKASEPHNGQSMTKQRNVADTDSISKSEKHKRSEYVINYDDKNGTVSSICKVKPGTTKKIVVLPEKAKESKSKTKSSDKKSGKS